MSTNASMALASLLIGLWIIWLVCFIAAEMHIVTIRILLVTIPLSLIWWKYADKKWM